MPHVIGGSRRASQDLPDAAITGAAPDPAPILQLGLGFWASKTLLSAVELGVFTELADGPLDAETLRARLGLHPRATLDFLDALVALGMLQRDERGYVDTPATGAVPGPREPRVHRRACSRWPTTGSTGSGPRSPRGCAPASRRTRSRRAGTSSASCTTTRSGCGSSCAP